jgi:hypothetical protein
MIPSCVSSNGLFDSTVNTPLFLLVLVAPSFDSKTGSSNLMECRHMRSVKDSFAAAAAAATTSAAAADDDDDDDAAAADDDDDDDDAAADVVVG